MRSRLNDISSVDQHETKDQLASVRPTNVDGPVSRSPSASPPSAQSRLQTDLRIETISRLASGSNQLAVMIPEELFKSNHLQSLWNYTKTNSISNEAKTAKSAILRDIKSRYTLECSDRPSDDDGFIRSFDHIFNDATLNIAFALMRLDRITAIQEQLIEQEEKSVIITKSIAPWAIHYKTELSKIMHESAKFLKTFKLNGSSEAKFGIETDKILHILNPQIETQVYGSTMDFWQIDKFKKDHANYFSKKQKRTIDGGRANGVPFDGDFQVAIPVCIGFKEKEALTGEKLQNVIDYYLKLFDYLYEMQIETNKKNIESLEAKTHKNAVEEAELTSLRNKVFVKLTAANITIFLLPFDGVNAPLSEVEKIAAKSMSGWIEDNETLTDKYPGIRVIEFQEFQKTIFYLMAKFLMQVFLVSAKAEIIARKFFDKDIESYLSKISDDETVQFKKVKSKKDLKPNFKNREDKEEAEQSDPHHLQVYNSPSSLTTGSLPGSPNTGQPLTSVSSPTSAIIMGRIEDVTDHYGSEKVSTDTQTHSTSWGSGQFQQADANYVLSPQVAAADGIISYMIRNRRQLNEDEKDEGISLLTKVYHNGVMRWAPPLAAPMSIPKPLPLPFPAATAANNPNSHFSPPRKSRSLPSSPETKKNNNDARPGSAVDPTKVSRRLGGPNAS